MSKSDSSRFMNRRVYPTLLAKMSRKPSLSPPPPAKRIKLDLTQQCTSKLNYRSGIFLAPMVRSGAREDKPLRATSNI